MLQYLENNKIDIPDDIKQILNECTASDKRFNYQKYNTIKTDKIENYIKDIGISIKELYYIFINNLSEIPSCPVCHKRLVNYKLTYCSHKCYSLADAPKEKHRETCLEKYGVNSYSKTDDYKEKVKETNLKHWGNESSFHSDAILEKIKKSNLEKYGVEYYTQTDEYKEKVKNTWLKKYGTTNPNKTTEVKEKIKKTSLERYGVDNYTKSVESKEKIAKLNRMKFYKSNSSNLLKNNFMILSTYQEYIDNDDVKYKCLLCNTEFFTRNRNVQSVMCSNKGCSRYNTSVAENNLYDYICSLYSKEIVKNDRKILNKKELDIYIPEKKLAIEYNGDYWHSTKIKDKKYHQEKTLECRENGIRLIHIFEYEWNNKQEICKSIIKSALGMYDTKIYARQCIVKEISPNDYKAFLELNHLQGSTNSSIRYGLFYNDELVSVIGFGKSRFKKNEMELHRFCCKLNYSIPGAFSKLIKHSNINNFITYVDLSHFSGDGYKKLGFKEISITEPNYKWIKCDDILNRFSTQKHKLAKLLENYDENLTEAENMVLNGYNQVFDSGNLKLEYQLY